MGFTELTREKSGTSVLVPYDGVVMGKRVAGRGATKAPYLTVKIGKNLAAELGCHLAAQNFAVRVGHGEDAGKMAISLDAKGKFTAKKQTAGYYLLTVPGSAIGDHMSFDFDTTVVDKARFVPARATDAPMVIVALPGTK